MAAPCAGTCPSQLSGMVPHFEVNYGAVPDPQLHLIAPLAYDSPPEGAGHYGMGDLELSGKRRTSFDAATSLIVFRAGSRLACARNPGRLSAA
jgi:hypothetical protein